MVGAKLIGRFLTSNPDYDDVIKSRSKIIVAIKWFLMLSIISGFILSVIMLSYGTRVVTHYISFYKSSQESLDCLEKIWTVFMAMNIFFTIIGLFGIWTEQVCCVFMFCIYCFFVTFGSFFDMINENHILLIYLVPTTLLSFVFMAIIRIERLDPVPIKDRKFSTISYMEKAWFLLIPTDHKDQMMDGHQKIQWCHALSSHHFPLTFMQL